MSALEIDGVALFSHQDVVGITHEVWGTYLGAPDELVDCPLDGGTGSVPASELVTASVSVAGVWAGHIVVTTTWQAALAIAGAMFQMPPTEITNADVTDAVGEVVNVVGGNVKSSVPDPSTLSLPLVARNATLFWPDAERIVDADFCWNGEPVNVSVWTARRSGSRAARG